MPDPKDRNTLYDPQPREDLKMPPVSARKQEGAVQSLPEKSSRTQDLKEDLGPVHLSI